MSGMANEIAARMRADGVDTSATPDAAMAGSPAQGTEGASVGTPPVASPAGESNADNGDRGTTPDTIPYSRFQEVNSQLQQLRQYEELSRLSISPDSAVRLANFEHAYQTDPKGTLAAMIDQQDLPDSQKVALKALLAAQTAADDDAGADGGDAAATPAPLPPEVLQAVGYVNELRERDAQRDTDQRLQAVVDHWRQQDEKDGIVTPERQRLLYIQSVAGSSTSFGTLEALSEAARNQFLEDRDANLGSAVQTRGTRSPSAVPSGGLPPTTPLPPPKSMREARKQIQADIAAGRLPDLATQ